MDIISSLEKQARFDARNRRQSLDALFQLGTNSSDSSTCLRAALTLKELGEIALSRVVLIHCRSVWPSDPYFAYEHVQLERKAGLRADADEVFISAIRAGIDGRLFVRDLLANLIGDARSGKLMSPAMVSAVAAVCLRCEDAYLKSISEVVLERLDEIVSAMKWLSYCHVQDPYDVSQSIIYHIERKIPFCLVRLGDGEGSVFQYMSDTHRGAASQTHIKYFAERWFGDSSKEALEKLRFVGEELAGKISEIDIIGIPQINWIEDEIRLRKTNVYINCLSSTIAAVKGCRSDQSIVDVSICIDMDKLGLFADIISRCSSISVLTSRSGLSKQISKSFGVGVRQELLIAPPASDPLARAGELSRGTHLLSNYEVVRESLKNIEAGEVVLVAGGILGKIYALDIKARGGISIDIGFLADLWAGFHSRPEVDYRHVGALPLENRT